MPGTVSDQPHADALHPESLVTALFDGGCGGLEAAWIAEQGPEAVASKLGVTVKTLAARLSEELAYADRVCIAALEVGVSHLYWELQTCSTMLPPLGPAWRSTLAQRLRSLREMQPSEDARAAIETLCECLEQGGDDHVHYLFTGVRRLHDREQMSEALVAPLRALLESVHPLLGPIFDAVATLARDRRTGRATGAGALWLDLTDAEQGQEAEGLLRALREHRERVGDERRAACDTLIDALAEGRFVEVALAALLEYQVWELGHTGAWLERHGYRSPASS